MIPSKELLRPCPFCGGEAVHCYTRERPRDGTSNAWIEGSVQASIACGFCGAKAKPYFLNTESRDPTDADVEHALLNAAIHWNARIREVPDARVP